MFFLRQKHLCSKFRVPLNFEDCLFGSLFFVRTAGRREATINTLPEWQEHGEDQATGMDQVKPKD